MMMQLSYNGLRFKQRCSFADRTGRIVVSGCRIVKFESQNRIWCYMHLVLGDKHWTWNRKFSRNQFALNWNHAVMTQQHPLVKRTPLGFRLFTSDLFKLIPDICFENNSQRFYFLYMVSRQEIVLKNSMMPISCSFFKSAGKLFFIKFLYPELLPIMTR